jgi:hypothetical protein
LLKIWGAIVFFILGLISFEALRASGPLSSPRSRLVRGPASDGSVFQGPPHSLLAAQNGSSDGLGEKSSEETAPDKVGILINCLEEGHDSKYCACLAENHPNLPESEGCVSNDTTLNASAKDSLDICSEAAQSASLNCDREKGVWLQSIQETSSLVAGSLHQLDSSLCGGIAAAQTGAQSGMAAFKFMCTSAVEHCLKVCPAGSRALLTCQKNRQVAGRAQQEFAKAMVSLKGSVTACQNAFGDLSLQAQAHCTQNPESCRLRFPHLKTSQTTDGSLSVVSQGSLDFPGKTATRSPGQGHTGLALDLDPNRRQLDQAIPAATSALGSGSGTAISPRGGGPAANISGSTGVGRGASSVVRPPKSGGLLTNILSGFFGNGSGGGTSSGLSSTLRRLFGNPFGGNEGLNHINVNGAPDANAKPDLQKFLPGAVNDPNRHRNIAGQFIGKDGVAGPHGNIWKSISNRYHAKLPTLLP